MYYDTYRGKRRGRNARRESERRGSCFGLLLRGLIKLLAIALVLALAACGVLYLLPVSFLNVEPGGSELSIADNLPENRVNILLLGLDDLNEGSQRSDSIIIASLGQDSLKFISILRDTMVEIPGHGRQKINAAYACGGPEMTMRVINETFNLNITNYVALDFSSMVDLVDAIGGVDIEIQDVEIEQLNKYAWNTYKCITKDGGTKYAKYAASQPYTAGGTLHLNGLFATGYSRVRKIDSDYMRTNRQRKVILAIIRRMRSNWYDPLMYARLFRVLGESVNTNLIVPELISVGEKVLVMGQAETTRMPRDEYISDNGSNIEIVNAQGNIQAMHQFIYN